MSRFSEALEKIFEVEFANKPEQFLHHNTGEQGFTLGGIYQKANPTEINWDFISSLAVLCATDLKRASVMLYHDKHTMGKVKEIYREKYWKPLKLDQVKSQKIAEELFLMGVVSGTKRAIMIAQTVVDVNIDGIIGKQTLNALNNFNEDDFDILYDNAEIEHFEQLAESKPRFKRFLDGWKNRSVFV